MKNLRDRGLVEDEDYLVIKGASTARGLFDIINKIINF